MNHETIEKKVGLMGVLIAIAISFGGLVEIVPLYFQGVSNQPSPGIKPYEALRLAGRDVYVREGCYNCHSQMIRPFRSETERYGPYSLAGESVYDHPFQFGSKRTGPDLARVGGRYSDDWHRVHLHEPARRRAGVEHAALPVARERRRWTVPWWRRRCACCAWKACPTPTTTSPAPRPRWRARPSSTR